MVAKLFLKSSCLLKTCTRAVAEAGRFRLCDAIISRKVLIHPSLERRPRENPVPSSPLLLFLPPSAVFFHRRKPLFRFTCFSKCISPPRFPSRALLACPASISQLSLSLSLSLSFRSVSSRYIASSTIVKIVHRFPRSFRVCSSFSIEVRLAVVVET